jgi:hypothetical protein
MYEFQTHHELAPHGWFQHHLPWLGLFAFVIALLRDDDEPSRPVDGSDSFFG